MAKHFDKESLFQNYLHTAARVIQTFEDVFQVAGTFEQVFGCQPGSVEIFENEADIAQARDRIRCSGAWYSLSLLFDYAVDGILPSGIEPEEVVIAGAEVLSYLTTENEGPSDDWQEIVALGDGRFALDDGDDIILEKVALLADVDVRTVRNAISAGELKAGKTEGKLVITNASARAWLSGRRGFTATRMVGGEAPQIEHISSPVEFGQFLTEQRKRIGLGGSDSKIVFFHPSVDARAIAELERGVFRLPLDTVFPLADFYQIDRIRFLDLVLRVFLPIERQAMTDLLAGKRGAV